MNGQREQDGQGSERVREILDEIVAASAFLAAGFCTAALVAGLAPATTPRPVLYGLILIASLAGSAAGYLVNLKVKDWLQRRLPGSFGWVAVAVAWLVGNFVVIAMTLGPPLLQLVG